MIVSELKDGAVYSTEIKPSRWRLVSGIIMLFFAAYIWFHPLATMVGLALYLGLAFIVMGIGYLAVSTKATIGRDMFVGILDILIGVIFVSNLGITAATMPIIFAFWSLAIGIVQLVEAYQLRKLGFSWGMSVISGVVGVVFAYLILAYPLLGMLTLSTIIGIYVLLYGMFEIMSYFMLKRI